MIDNFPREQPDLKVREIRQAMRLALMGESTSGQLVAIILGLILAVIAGLFAFFLRTGSGGGGQFPVIAVAVAAIVIGLVVFVLRNRS